MGRRRCVDGDEQDVHDSPRDLHAWLHRAGAAAAVKRRTRRRERREARQETREERFDDHH